MQSLRSKCGELCTFVITVELMMAITEYHIYVTSRMDRARDPRGGTPSRFKHRRADTVFYSNYSSHK